MKKWVVKALMMDCHGMWFEIASEPLPFTGAKKLQNRLFDVNGIDSHISEVK